MNHPAPRKIRVLHLVKWFYAGGAERLLTDILRHSDSSRFEHIVVSLSDEGERIATLPDTLGIPYHTVHIRRGALCPKEHYRCFQLVRRLKPDVIKSWLPPANITGGIIGKLLNIPVLWGIHDSQPPGSHSKKQFKFRKLARHILCCSYPVHERCLAAGYPLQQLSVIPNGVDTEFFRPLPDEGQRLRAELGLPENALVIGMAAEAATVKRHLYFLQAARLFAQSHANAYFLLCGKSIDPTHPLLAKAVAEMGLESRVHLLGIRDAMPQFYSALDIHTLCSRHESFGLAVAEAMACMTRCVTTDCGMMRSLMGQTGIIIPVSDDPAILADAWEKTLSLPPEEQTQQREAGRQHIRNTYSITTCSALYDRHFAKAAGESHRICAENRNFDR